MRKYRSFLSPDDALRDLRKHASQGAEIRWELHTSRTDVDLAGRGRCGCHSLTPREEKRHPERGDLRKHHSAETDKWSLRPDAEHDLRKHLSDDSRMDRELRWTLQVPELHANPKQRCTCPRPPAQPSPAGSAPRGSGPPTPEAAQEAPRQQQQQQQQQQPPQPLPAALPPTQPRERAQPTEARRALRTRWGGKPHLSLPAERKDSKWVRPPEEGKSKSLKERPKYSVRRSLSPDPDPRQVLRLDSRVVRRLISPEVSIMDAKWAPYEGYSPLPNVGIKKRETKKISDIKWQPYDESPAAAAAAAIPEPPEPEPEPPGDWSPFHNITPTHLPPPVATPARNEEEEFRWRFLNQVSAFPIYQGAWREESPPPSPPPPDTSTPVWSPQPPQPQPQPPPPASPAPPPQPQRAPLRARAAGRRKASRARSQEGTRGPEPPAEERPRAARPQLQRSQALLDVPQAPHMDASKRSLSEEVRSHSSRSESTRRGLIFRAKSEDAARHGEPWFVGGPQDRQELREYVTTV